MKLLRILLAIASTYLSWTILPNIFLFLLLPFIVGGKNPWLFNICELLSLLIGFYIAWQFWLFTANDQKKRTLVLTSIALVLILSKLGGRYIPQYVLIMGYEPKEAAKNVVLKYDPQANISELNFIEIGSREVPTGFQERFNSATKYRPNGRRVEYDVKSDTTVVYKVSVVLQPNNKWWYTSKYEKIQN